MDSGRDLSEILEEVVCRSGTRFDGNKEPLHCYQKINKRKTKVRIVGD